MKNILVVAAMDLERDLLLSWMTAQQEIILANGATVIYGELDEQPLYLLLCGIGKVNAAISCSLALAQLPISLVVNSGIAGSLQSAQKPGDMVISYQATYHDVDVTSFGYKRGQLPGGPELFEGDANAALFLSEASNKMSFTTMTGLVVSGDQFINQTAAVDFIRKNFPKALCVEMEAAAIAHSAVLQKKPFVIIRAISDRADSDAKSDYASFAKLAAEHSAQLVRTLVNSYA